MTIIESKGPTPIIGVELKTTNDNNQAFQDIPPFWNRFYQEQIFEQIPNKHTDDIFALYTHFENHGINNHGIYSLIIGAHVTSLDTIPTGFVSTTIPHSDYVKFDVESKNPQKSKNEVGEKWLEIWNHSFEHNRSFTCEFEQYKPSGDIAIFIGVN